MDEYISCITINAFFVCNKRYIYYFTRIYTIVKKQICRFFVNFKLNTVYLLYDLGTCLPTIAALVSY